MKKKIALMMALIMSCGCVFASCKKTPTKNPTNEGGTTEPSALESAVPVYVSEKAFDYATNPDGSLETVTAIDENGKVHTYLKGIKHYSANAPEPVGGEADQATQLFEQEENDVVGNFIEILNSGKFALDGYITTDGEKVPLTFSTYEKNLRMGTEISGISLDFAIIDNVTYLLSSKNKSYIELTEAIRKRFSLDDTPMTFDGFGEIKNEQAIKSEATYNGKTVDCYSTPGPEGEVKFYVDGDKVVKLDVLDNTGVCTTMIEINSIQGNLPPEALQIPSDYTKKSYMQFIGDVIGGLDE